MKILIVDDDPDVVQFFKEAATDRGYTDIDIAYSGEEALTQVIRGSYDLITLDIRMPGASGLEILTLLRNLRPHAIIAIVSGHLPEKISAETAGCADVIIRKPIHLRKFTGLLNGAARIFDTMQEIRLLGDVSCAVE